MKYNPFRNVVVILTVAALIWTSTLQAFAQTISYQYLPLVGTAGAPPPPPHLPVRHLAFNVVVGQNATPDEITAAGGRCGITEATAASISQEICVTDYDGGAWRARLNDQDKTMIPLNTGNGVTPLYTPFLQSDRSLPTFSQAPTPSFQETLLWQEPNTATVKIRTDLPITGTTSMEAETGGGPGELEQRVARKLTIDEFYRKRNVNPVKSDTALVTSLKMRGSPLKNPVPTAERGLLGALCGQYLKYPVYVLIDKALLLGGELYLHILLFEDESGAYDSLQFHANECLAHKDAEWTSYDEFRRVLEPVLQTELDQQYETSRTTLIVSNNVTIGTGDWTSPSYEDTVMYSTALASTAAYVGIATFIYFNVPYQSMLITNQMGGFPLAQTSK